MLNSTALGWGVLNPTAAASALVEPMNPIEMISTASESKAKQHLLSRRLLIWLAAMVGAALFHVQPCRAEPIRVYIMAGQSNMVGGAPEPAPSNLSPQADILYQYRLEIGVNPIRRHESTTWGPLRTLAGLGVGSSYGSELSFGNAMASREAGKVAIIKTAANGTSLATRWMPSQTDSAALYPWMIEKVNSSLDELRGQGYDPTIEGFVWIQGEGDAGAPDRAAAYGANLGTLASALRSDLNVPNLPFLLNELHANLNRAYRNEVRQGQRAAAAADPNMHIVNGDDLGLLSDSVHFLSSTHIEMGRRLADLLAPSADFNYDGVVNASDLAVWKSSVGVNRLGDANSDGVTDGTDFLLWQRQFALAGSGSLLASSIPEPTSWLIAAVFSPAVLGISRRRL